jgi:hypothetical protein
VPELYQIFLKAKVGCLMNEKIISADILNKYQLPDVEEVNRLLTEEAESSCVCFIIGQKISARLYIER